MARIIGSCLLLASSCHVVGARFVNDYEVFPLSGGLTDGVDVNIKVPGWKNSGSSILEFVGPSGKMALKWSMSNHKKYIYRSNPDYPQESSGGWPFEDEKAHEKPVSFTFTKRKSSLVVTINGKRTPWLDWNHASAELITHLRVEENFGDAEVLMTRPLCATECHPDECMATDGSSTCQDGPCYATMPAGQCANTSSLPPAGMHCCDGLPNQIAMIDSSVNKWAEVIKDASVLASACKSYKQGGQGYGDLKGCELSGGQQVRITEVLTKFGAIWAEVPALNFERVLFPAAVLAARKPLRAIFKMPKMDLAGMTLQSTYGFVTAVTGEADTTHNVPLYWYVNMMTTYNLDVWKAFSFARFEAVQATPVVGSESVNILLTNQDVARTACSDEYSNTVPFSDTGSVGCAGYETNQWCDELGEPTDAWAAARGNQTFEEAKDPYHGKSAVQVCCTCGGGVHDSPPEAQSTLLLSV